MSNKYAGELADGLLALAESDKPAIVAAIQAAEGGAEKFASDAVKAALAQKGGPLAAVLAKYADAAVAGIFAKYGPEAIYDFLDLEAHALVKSLGG